LLRRLQRRVPENIRLTPDPGLILRILRNIRILNQLPPPLSPINLSENPPVLRNGIAF
jgi:hypothetical protein